MAARYEMNERTLSLVLPLASAVAIAIAWELTVQLGDIRELILSGGTAIDIKRKAAEAGMISLRRSGLIKIKDGITTIEEVVRETVL